MKVSWLAPLVLFCAVQVFSGPNQNARIRVDMDPSTFGVSSVEASRTSATAGETFSVLIVAENVSNIDAYVFRLVFDTTRLGFSAADFKYGDRQNMLDAAGEAIGVPIRRKRGINTTIDTIEIARTLVGSDPAVAPDGFGLLGSVRFVSKLTAGGSTSIGIASATILDCFLESDTVRAANRFGGAYSYMPIHTVAVVSSPADRGSVTLNPPGGSYSHNSIVTLTATPVVGYQFAGWSGDLSGTTNPASLTVNSSKSITANYSAIPYTLTVAVTGSGSVTRNPSKSSYVYDEVVSLTATPAVGWRFVRWEDGITGTTNPGSVTIKGNTTVTAVFEREQYTLTIDVTGSGSVTRNPQKTTYTHNEVVSLTPVPAAGWRFLRWGGAISGSANPGSVTITGNTVVTAVFEQERYALTVTPVGQGSVSLDPQPTGGLYLSGTTVQLTAIPASNWNFAGFSGDLTGSNPSTTIVMNGPKTVTATFSLTQHIVAVSAGANGTVTPSGNQTVIHGATLDVTAIPSEGFSFLSWTVSGGVAVVDNSANGRFTITGPGSISASFAQTVYTLIVTSGPNGSATPTTPVSLSSGQSTVITATPAPGFFFDRWTVISGTVNIDDRFASATTAAPVSGSGSVRADFLAAGSVQITGIGSGSKVYLFATNGWQGSEVRVGPGSINGLKPGNYLLSVQQVGMRTEYQAVTIGAGETKNLAIALRPVVPLAFDALNALVAGSSPISTGASNCAVLEDFDRDGDLDLLIGRNNGGFDFYEKQDAGYVPASGPRTISGAPLIASGGILGLRIIDWGHDNTIDLAVLTTGPDRIMIYPQLPTRGERVHGDPIVVYTASGAIDVTGFDIADINGDGYPDLVLGYADGTIKHLLSATDFSWSAPSWAAPQPVLLTDGAPVMVTSEAMPCMIDISGSGVSDLLVGTARGEILHFSIRSDGKARHRGSLLVSGRPVEMTGNVSSATVYGGPGELPSLVISDGTGAVLVSRGVLRGDFTKASILRDGKVMVEDLSLFGDSWGAIEGDARWEWQCNLDPTPGPGGKQVIDIFDLSLFGDSWLKEK